VIPSFPIGRANAPATAALSQPVAKASRSPSRAGIRSLYPSRCLANVMPARLTASPCVRDGTWRDFGRVLFFRHSSSHAGKQALNNGIQSLQSPVPPVVEPINHEGNSECQVFHPRFMT
jgi:hypothetical protein